MIAKGLQNQKIFKKVKFPFSVGGRVEVISFHTKNFLKEMKVKAEHLKPAKNIKNKNQPEKNPMARKTSQKAIEKVQFNIVSKVSANHIIKILDEEHFDFPKVLKEHQTVKTHLNYVFQVKNIVPERASYVGKETRFEITFTRRKIPFSILVAIDKSFSMKKQFNEESTKREVVENLILEFFEENVASQNKVGCVSFGLDWDLLFEPQQIEEDDISSLRKKLQSIKNSGRATPSAALSAGVEIFESEEKKFLKRLVILTDGVDPLGQDPLELIDIVRSEGIVVDVVFLGKKSDSESVAILEKISRLTRGKLLIGEQEEEIEEFLKKISQKAELLLTNRISEAEKGLKEENINKEERTTPSEIFQEEREKEEKYTRTIPSPHLKPEEEVESMLQVEQEGELRDEEISDVIVIGTHLPDTENEGESESMKRIHQTPRLIDWLKMVFLKLKKRLWDTD